MDEANEAEARTATPGRWRDRDHTRGSLLTSLFVLALPMLASSGLIVLFQVFDLAFLAELGEAPMASVIIVNQTLRQLVMMLLMGGAFGSQALVARAVGQGDREGARRVAGQVVLLGAAYSLTIAALGLAIPDLLFSLAGPDPSFTPYGVPYLRLVLVLSFGVAGTQLFAAILGGAGDTTTPFFVMVLQTTIAIFAEWVLIFGHLGAPALGVRGVALGIGAGQISGMGVGLWVLFRGRSRVNLSLRHLRPDFSEMRRILKLSWPPAVQMGSQVVMVAAYLRLAREFGESVQAAYAVGLRLGMIVPMVCFPLAGACATLVGQALGAHDAPRAWRAIRVGLLVHGSIMWSFAIALFLLRVRIMELLSNDPQVIEVGAEYLQYLSGAFVAWAFYFVFLRSLQGAGDMLVPMLISVGSTFLVAIPLAIVLSQHTALGRTGLWIAFLATSVVTTAGTGLRLATGRWTRRAAHSAGGPAPA